MKKIVISLLLMSVLCGLSAKSASIQINIEVPEVPVTYELFYDGVNIDEAVNYEITAPTLTTDHTTGLFEIIASGNKLNALPVTVNVTPSEFKATVNTVVYNSGITPAKNIIASIPAFPIGRHINLSLYSFTLSWIGDNTLSAGEYSSDVTIEYSVM